MRQARGVRADPSGERSERLLRVLVCLLAVAGGALFLACAGDDDSESEPTATAAPDDSPSPTTSASPTEEPATETPSGPADTTVGVTLREYSIEPEAESGPAGEFAFAVRNFGPGEGHVFMVIETDLAPDELPTKDTGEFDPAGGGAVLLAQTPGLGVEATDTLRITLEAGKYVFICNNVNGQGEGHYGLGMRAGFTVE
jgi:hypothetical protein